MGRDVRPPNATPLRRSGTSYLNRHGRFIPPNSTASLVSNSVPGLGTMPTRFLVNRRLEDRIREMCAEAIAARNEDEFATHTVRTHVRPARTWEEIEGNGGLQTRETR
jgi:hypothetical protein